MTTNTDAAFDIAIVCTLSAEERAERGQDFERLFAEAEGVEDRDDGYAFRLPNRDILISRATELIVAERKCCLFFSFTLAFEPNNGPIWLHVSGPGEVKTFIREQLMPDRLRTAG